MVYLVCRAYNCDVPSRRHDERGKFRARNWGDIAEKGRENALEFGLVATDIIGEDQLYVAMTILAK